VYSTLNQKKMGVQMQIELIAMSAVAVAVTAAATATGVAFVLERRMDVLHGPFIEGRASFQTPEQKLLELASSVVDQLRWRMRNMMYLTSIVAG
jgi:hypothetical protein